MDATNAKTATLTVGNKTYDFPILSGTVGPEVIDIGKLYAQSGMFTYDPGFTSTASCQSKITYIDGDAGILNIAATRSSSSPITATSSRPATFCSTESFRPPRKRRTLTIASPITPWFTSRWRASSKASAATPIRWP